MTTNALSLMDVYRGWDGYQSALVQAIGPRTPAELAWRGAARLRSVGEIASHVSSGRAGWFHHGLGEGGAEFAREIAEWRPEAAIVEDAAELVRRLEVTWRVVEAALRRWTTEDLATTFRHEYQGRTYDVPRQWVVWRVLTHDVHHGGELALALGVQGIAIPELGDQGGHLTELAEVETP
ncbi:MAG TPA: DinB family protein [Methylomirabilota bacterium]|nr:DinB family protein [Methylomirabilota bacterium]